MKVQILAIALGMLLFNGCSENSTKSVVTTTTTQEERNSENIFPKELSLSSLTNDTSLEARSIQKRSDPSSQLTRIDEILNGTLPINDAFTPELLFSNAIDADCYGPHLLYKNNPDENTTNSGELPTGDLGIWTLNEGNTTQACTAAQLDARMTGVKNRSMSGLFLLAGLLDTMYDNNLTIPTAGSSLNLISYMPTIPDVLFARATIEHQLSGEFKYVVDFSYSSSRGVLDVKFETYHNSGSSSDNYKGLMKYEIEDTMNGGNCGTGSHDITRKGSLVYQRVSSDDFKVDAREADFCTHSFSGGFDLNGTLDPTDRYDVSSNTDGWGNNYNRFVANYKKSNKSGQYSYVWQAGPHDSHSRVLQVDLNNHNPVDGESYFGYGAQVYDSSATFGENLGLICNWAGPGANHTPSYYAQRQFLRYSGTTEFFETSEGGSDITYAPTNSCKYDGSMSFEYDRDLDNNLTSSDIAIVKVDANTSLNELEFDLFEGNSTTPISQKILDRGANLPVAPVW